MITLYLPVCLRPQKKKGEKSCEGGGFSACSLQLASCRTHFCSLQLLLPISAFYLKILCEDKIKTYSVM